MEIQTFDIAGVILLTPRHIGDERGYFAETFRADIFAEKIGDYVFVQDNESRSACVGTIRGLHFQWVGETLTPDNGKQLWVPPGFAHGFCSLEPDTVIAYKVAGGYYNAGCDKGLAWDDPAIGITWPDAADADTLSAKDRKQPLLADLPAYFSWSK